MGITQPVFVREVVSVLSLMVRESKLKAHSARMCLVDSECTQASSYERCGLWLNCRPRRAHGRLRMTCGRQRTARGRLRMACGAPNVSSLDGPWSFADGLRDPALAQREILETFQKTKGFPLLSDIDKVFDVLVVQVVLVAQVQDVLKTIVLHGLQIVENIVEIFDSICSLGNTCGNCCGQRLCTSSRHPCSSRYKRFVHSELFQRDVTDVMRLAWKFLVVVVSQSFQEVVKAAGKRENTAPSVIEIGFHSSATVDVEHCTTSTRWSMSPCAGRAGASARWSMSRVVQVDQVPQVQVMDRTIELADLLKHR